MIACRREHGYPAKLYYYNPDTKSLSFLHASEYIVVLEKEEKAESITQAADEAQDETAGAILFAMAGIAVFVWKKKADKENSN